MYDTSGIYVDTLQAQAGCDSIATLNLTIKDLNVGDTTILVACDSAEWNGVTYDTSGIYVDTLQSIAGCETITLDLTINNYNASDVKIVVQICRYLGGIKWSIYRYTTNYLWM